MIRDIYRKVIKRRETKVEKARMTLNQVKTTELKKKNARIIAYKKLKKQLHKKFKAYLKA